MHQRWYLPRMRPMETQRTRLAAQRTMEQMQGELKNDMGSPKRVAAYGPEQSKRNPILITFMVTGNVLWAEADSSRITKIECAK